MKHKAEIVLRALNLRLGYGDPAACKYVFIGIEEGGGPYDLDDFSLDVKPMDMWVGPVSKARNQWSPVYTIMSKIVASLENIADLEEYQVNRMCHAGDITILINLFPLPKKSIDAWPYDRTLTREQYQEWLFYHLCDRYAAIRLALSNMPCLKATICFGSTYWQDFINCLNLSSDHYNEMDAIRVYDTRKTLLTPFFQYKYGTISDDDIPRFAEAIRSLEQSAASYPSPLRDLLKGEPERWAPGEEGGKYEEPHRKAPSS